MNILFYSAKYYKAFGSIFPTEDICSLIPKEEADVAILEEPEHLNWFRAADPSITLDDKSPTAIYLGWASKFKFVVGVIHTNYAAYMKQYGIGTSLVGAPAISAMSAMVVRAYCHRVIRLSGVIPNYAKWKEVTSNVHGVRGDFLTDGSDAIEKEESMDSKENGISQKDEVAPVYFIGKLLWAKGFDRMLKIQEMFRDKNEEGKYFSIDVYGGGPDETAIK